MVNFEPIDLLSLETADASATSGWIGDALRSVGRFVAAARQRLGDAHEITRTAMAYRDAIAREHYNTATATYDPDALHVAYLTVRGAVAVASQAVQKGQPR